MPVTAATSARLGPRSWRSDRSRGPTVASAWSVSSVIRLFCHIGKLVCQSSPGRASWRRRSGGTEMSSSHDHGPEMFDAAFWDARYSSAHALWSGNPNRQLVTEAAGLAPGTALDAGAGEGADAIWLAERGWQVTAVDVSGVALGRAADHAAKAGDEVAARIRWQREDLREWIPPERAYDLVTSQYLHLP